MLALVGEVFDVKNDPDQIDVDESARAKLQLLHPATMSEFANDDGPIAWILLIPTTLKTMNQFVAGDITEKQLLEQTQPGDPMEAVYLCSASVLPEFRKQGIASRLTLDALRRMSTDFSIKALFFWKFSDNGAQLAHQLAEHLSIPLYERK